MFGDIFGALWLFACFLNFGFSIVAWIEGTFLSFLLSLLLVPLGPITLATQWALFHKTHNDNLEDLTKAIRASSESGNKVGQTESLLANAAREASEAAESARGT